MIFISQIKIVFSILALSIIATAMLMPIEAAGQGKSEEVTIIAPYNPTVTTAQKINRNPRIKFTETEKLPDLKYDIHSVRINTSVTPDNPRPSRVPGETQKDLYRSHLRAGIGNYITPYFELWVNSLQSDEFNAGAHIGHLSSFGRIKDYGKSTYSNTLFEAYASKFFNDNTFDARLAYSNRMVHRYGYKPDDYPLLTIEGDDIRQAFNKMSFDLGLSSNHDDDDAFNYHIKMDGYYLFDRYESKETGLFFNTGIAKKLDLFGNRRSQELGLELNADYYLNDDGLHTYNGGVFAATPFLDMDLEPYRIFVGLKTVYRMDSISKVHIYPLIRAEASLLEDVVMIYAGMGGGLDRVSFELLSSENPFVNSILPLDYSDRYDLYGGVQGRITEVVDYNFGMKYQLLSNLPLFVNDTSNVLGNTFDVVYDDAGIFTFHGELGFRSRSDFGLLAKAAYNAYSLDHELKPWHKPALEISLETFYTIREKLRLNANLTSMHGVYARTFTDGLVHEKQLDAWLDLGLGAEYQINSQFSAFIQLNNLLNNGYFKWYQYPVQKFNALAGIGFSF
ncbi:MAG: TonB-dependent receptor [Bacteroidota bacterium]